MKRRTEENSPNNPGGSVTTADTKSTQSPSPPDGPVVCINTLQVGQRCYIGDSGAIVRVTSIGSTGFVDTLTVTDENVPFTIPIRHYMRPGTECLWASSRRVVPIPMSRSDILWTYVYGLNHT